MKIAPGLPQQVAVWATLGLIAISAFCGAITDLSFDARGYSWQIANCALTAGYSLSLRGAMDKASAHLFMRASFACCTC